MTPLTFLQKNHFVHIFKKRFWVKGVALKFACERVGAPAINRA